MADQDASTQPVHAARKDGFLAHLAVTADVRASALAAGVCSSTVYSHRHSDPAFAAAWVTALACGVAVLEGRLVQQRLEAHEAFALEAGELPPEVAARERDLEFWRAMHLLREHRRAAGGGAPARQPRGQRPRIKSNAEVRAEMAKALKAFEGRVRANGYRLE